MPSFPILADAVRAASNNTPAFDNRSARGLLLMVEVTTAPSSSITPKLQLHDQTADVWGDYIAATAITATGTHWIVFDAVELEAASDDVVEVLKRALPQAEWRIAFTHGDSSDWQYSVAGAYFE